MNTPGRVPWTAGSLCLERDVRGVVIRVVEYHGAPVHLDQADLRHLGISICRPSPVLSYAERWASKLARPPDSEPRGPSLLDPEWICPTGVQVEGLLFVPVRGGLDLYVTDYHCDQVLLDDGHLERLGLHLVRERVHGHDRRGD